MSRELRWRLIAWYIGAVGSVTAIPWIASSLSAAGLTGPAVAGALLLLPIGHLVAAPAWSALADHSDPRRVLGWTTSGSALAGFALAAASSAETLIAALAVFALFRAGIFPVGDGLTLRLLGTERRSYGQIRAMGSIAFAVFISLGGLIKDDWPDGPLWIGAALMAVTAVVTRQLPSPERIPSRPGITRILEVARDPVLGPLALVGVLHGLTITTYDSLYALHIEQLGLPAWVAGASFATGVAVEVTVLWLAYRWLHTIGPVPLLLIGIASGIPRWWLTGTASSPAVLAATQALHGLGFGAYWAAGVALFDERAPDSARSSAQSLFTVSTFGVGYLASMGLAAVVLDQHDTATLFRLLVGVSAAALTLGIAVALRARRSEPAI